MSDVASASQRLCPICDRPLAGRRRQARTCSANCRKTLSRIQQRKARSPVVVIAPAEWPPTTAPIRQASPLAEQTAAGPLTAEERRRIARWQRMPMDERLRLPMDEWWRIHAALEKQQALLDRKARDA